MKTFFNQKMALKFTHNLNTKNSLYYGNRVCIKYIFGFLYFLYYNKQKKNYFLENIINSIESNKPNLMERVVL